MGYFRSESQRPDLERLEEEILTLWDREDTFVRSVEMRKGSEKFVFVEGPPTANGLPHPGHILTRIVLGHAWSAGRDRSGEGAAD